MTPNDIEVLLHYYTTPIEHERYDAPAVQKAIRNFVENNILKIAYTNGKFVVTERGEKLVQMLCATPYPENRWIDPREEHTCEKRF